MNEIELDEYFDKVNTIEMVNSWEYKDLFTCGHMGNEGCDCDRFDAIAYWKRIELINFLQVVKRRINKREKKLDHPL